MSASNQIDYEFEDEEGVQHFATVTYFYTAGRAANTRYGHPDNYSPAEAAEIDITEIALDDKPLSKEKEIAFLADFEDRILDAIEAREQAAYEAEYERED